MQRQSKYILQVEIARKREKRFISADTKHRITTLMHDLLTDPVNFSEHVDRATASSASIALFGQRAQSHDDFWATVSQPPMDVESSILTDAGRL